MWTHCLIFSFGLLVCLGVYCECVSQCCQVMYVCDGYAAFQSAFVSLMCDLVTRVTQMNTFIHDEVGLLLDFQLNTIGLEHIWSVTTMYNDASICMPVCMLEYEQEHFDVSRQYKVSYSICSYTERRLIGSSFDIPKTGSSLS